MRKIKEYPLNGKLKPSELKKIPKAELLLLLEIITLVSKNINNQIDIAYKKKKKYGTRIDHAWLTRAKKSKQIKKLHIAMVENELSV